MKKIFLTAVIAVFVILLGWRIFRSVSGTAGGAGGGKQMQQAVAVEVTPVVKGTIRDVKQFTGSLLPRSGFIVAPKVAGYLEKITVDMGDSVKNGQLIALLDSQEYLQAVEQARAALDVAKANVAESKSALEVAKREFERIQILREKQIASESELDGVEAGYKTSHARYKVALAQVEQAEAALKAAEVRLSYTRIKVSWQGENNRRFIGERYADEGTMLRANDPIVSVLDIDTLKAVIDITEDDYSMVHIGQPVVLKTDAYSGREFTGKIVRKSPELKETSRTAGVEALISNLNYMLKPGMFVRAEIEMARHEKVVIVPYASLTKREGKQGVFLLNQKDMKVEFIPVETGIVTSELVEIVSPPIDGYVVTLGQHLLDKGSSVVLPEKKENSSIISENAKQPGQTPGKRGTL
jgi:RND family efflux transporter MFP subunit